MFFFRTGDPQVVSLFCFFLLAECTQARVLLKCAECVARKQ